jgi:hypothetical protein
MGPSEPDETAEWWQLTERTEPEVLETPGRCHERQRSSPHGKDSVLGNEAAREERGHQDA